MGIEIVVNEMDPAGQRIGPEDVPDEESELAAGTIRSSPCKMPACFRFDHTEDVGGTVALVFVIAPQRPLGAQGLWRAELAMQRTGFSSKQRTDSEAEQGFS